MFNEDKYIKKIIKDAHALLTLSEAKLLFSLAKNIDKKGVILEIGSYKGGSAILLAKSSKLISGEKVYTIDPHSDNIDTPITIGFEHFPKTTLSIFKKNIKRAEVDDWIVPIIKTSYEAEKNWNKPIKLLWIDGLHFYNSVKMDFLLWEKYLIEGGIIAFHDTLNNNKNFNEIIDALGFLYRGQKGPTKVVNKYILKSKRFKDIKKVGLITYAKKSKKASSLELLRNELDARTMTRLFGNIIKKFRKLFKLY